MPKSGTPLAEEVFLGSVAEMQSAAKTGSGMIVGQNFMPFDMPVVNSEMKRIMHHYQGNQSALDFINKTSPVFNFLQSFL